MKGTTVEDDRAECRRRWWWKGKDGKPCLPSSEGAEEDLERLAHLEHRGTDTLYDDEEQMAPYSRIMHLVVTAMGSNEARERGLTFGAAVQHACRYVGLREQLPEEIEAVILKVAFEVIASGRIPGQPDA